MPGTEANEAVGAVFAAAIPVTAEPGAIGFGDAGIADQLFGGEVQPVTSRMAQEPAGNGTESRLAHTGSTAAMLVLLIGGLLSLLIAGPLLGRRRKR
jgi:LPXTG-motif cell wall-anchored protein